MPLQSKAQQGWMFANHPRMAKRWAEHTPDIKSLPEHVGDKEKKSAFALLGKLAAGIGWGGYSHPGNIAAAGGAASTLLHPDDSTLSQAGVGGLIGALGGGAGEMSRGLPSGAAISPGHAASSLGRRGLGGALRGGLYGAGGAAATGLLAGLAQKMFGGGETSKPGIPGAPMSASNSLSPRMTPGSPSTPRGAPATPSSTPETAGGSQVGDIARKAAPYALGGLGIYGLLRLLRRRKKEEKVSGDRSLTSVRRTLVKRASKLLREKSAQAVINLLDHIAPRLPLAKQASMRVLQHDLAAGHSLANSLKVAYPLLTGEQRGIVGMRLIKAASAMCCKSSAPRSYQGPHSQVKERMFKEAIFPGMMRGLQQAGMGAMGGAGAGAAGGALGGAMGGGGGGMGGMMGGAMRGIGGMMGGMLGGGGGQGPAPGLGMKQMPPAPPPAPPAPPQGPVAANQGANPQPPALGQTGTLSALGGAGMLQGRPGAMPQTREGLLQGRPGAMPQTR